MKTRLPIILFVILLAAIISGCETSDNIYQNDGNTQDQTGDIRSGDLKEGLSNFNVVTTCDSDADCILFDTELKENACWSCESIDYSQDNWVGANDISYDRFSNMVNEYRQKYCGPMPGCPVTITNINYEARCVNNVCEKVNVEDQTNDMECAQKNYGNPDYCEGLSDGDKVPSCDCNGCSCIKMADGKLYPTCTERGCGPGKTWPYN